MIIAFGADKKTKTTNAAVEKLKKDGHKVLLFGDLKNPNNDWVNIAKDVALTVKNKKADEGILFCWTGTGVAMVASKIPGVRAVTVSNKKIAKQARAWDQANILCLSCFISPKKALGIIDIWFKTSFGKDVDDLAAQEQIKKIEQEF